MDALPRTDAATSPAIETTAASTGAVELRASHPVAAAGEGQTHALLVTAAVLRYQSTAPTATTLPDVRALPAGHAQLEAQENRRAMRYFLGFMGTGIGGTIGTLTTLTITGSQPLGFSMLAGIVAVGATCFTKMVRTDSRTDARKAARRVTVPSAVAEAYRRIMSATAEIEALNNEETNDRSPAAEIVASARLAVGSAREMVVLLADHHAAGTFHTPAAQALAGEVYRLAAEMDAYLTIRNADRFAPAEEDTLALVSTTSPLVFGPQA